MSAGEPRLQPGVSRRTFLKRAGGAGVGVIALGGLPALLAACGGSKSASSVPTGAPTASFAASTVLKVLANQPPDPAPPGDAAYSEQAFATWKASNRAEVVYTAIPFPQVHDKLATAFASGNPPWDVVYMSGWVPEFSEDLVDLGSMLPQTIKDDMPKSSFTTVTWKGTAKGVVFSLSLPTLMYNTELFANAGLTAAPKTWDDMKLYAKELTRPGYWGYETYYATPEGIGGNASQWQIFLQEAGGTMYAEDGMPVFNNAAGVDALQFMIDLMPYTDPGSLSYPGIVDTTNVFTAGKAAMMLNWPFEYEAANDPTQSKIVGKVAMSIIPAGPVSSASIDGTDAWTITKFSKSPELAAKLIEFYLDPAVQKQMCLVTGWLPIRLSVLADPDVQKKAPQAEVVMEQAGYPYDDFLTPDYIEITQAIGTQIQSALQGTETAQQAIQNAYDETVAIVKRRS